MAFFKISLNCGLHFSDLTAQVIEDTLGLDRIVVKGDVECVVKIDNWGQPVCSHKTWVTGNKQRSVKCFPDPDVVKIHLQRWWCDNVFDIDHATTQGIADFLPCLGQFKLFLSNFSVLFLSTK